MKLYHYLHIYSLCFLSLFDYRLIEPLQRYFERVKYGEFVYYNYKRLLMEIEAEKV